VRSVEKESKSAVSEENKAVVRRFYEEWVHLGNLAVVDEIIAPKCPLCVGSTLMGTGPGAFKQFRARMYSGFPDLRFTIEDLVAQGDKVADRVSVRGMHQREFMEILPTGKRVEFSAINLAQIRKGKIVESRGMPDMLGLMRQIGAIPKLGEHAGS
jgi:predicted ester cyclase